MLQRSLGRLKTSLDRVESARAGQVAARQDLALLLTGADEELSAALEASLAGKTGRPDRSFLDKWRVWWEQKRAWQQRLDALEPAGDGEDSAEALGQEAKRIRQEARQAQWDREKAILDVLESRRALPSAEIRPERARLKARFSAVRP